MNPTHRHHALALSLLLAACLGRDDVTAQSSTATDADTTASTSSDLPTTSSNTPEPDEGSTSGSTTAPPSDSSDSSTTGSDDTTDEGGSSSTTEDRRIGCVDEETCVAATPAGWSGPTAVYRGAEAPPDCPDEFPTLAFEANHELVAPAPTCSCSCGNGVGATCSTIVRENGPNCALPQGGFPWWSLPGNECQPISAGTSVLRSDAPIIDTSNASCPVTSNENVPAAAFATTVRACEAPERATLCEDGGQCLPIAPDPYAEVCIYAEGDYPCPAGPFSERTLLHTDLEDTRGCTDCSCTDPTGTCTGTVTYQTACMGGLIGILAQGPVGTCHNMNSAPGAAHYTAQSSVSCQPAGGIPQGEATPTNPVTLCCTP